MWRDNITVNRTYSTTGALNAYADIGTWGWTKIKAGAADGVTNTLILLSAAKANGRTVNVFVDSTNEITRAVLN